MLNKVDELGLVTLNFYPRSTESVAYRTWEGVEGGGGRGKVYWEGVEGSSHQLYMTVD